MVTGENETAAKTTNAMTSSRGGRRAQATTEQLNGNLQRRDGLGSPSY